MSGQKAENLKKLRGAGMNIPEFTVLNFNDYKQNGIPDDIGEGLFAVRSAFSLEDGDSDSFAGQFSTFLDVPREKIGEYAEKCFSSLESESVKAYLAAKNITVSSIGRDIIIQKMVHPDISGVLFTSNPQGILNESVITVGRGIGEGVVSDRTDTTTYYYSLTDDVYYYEGENDLLDDRLVRALIDISIKIKEIIGGIIDIEFAVKDGEIFILQARRVTTMNGDDPLILDNSNIVESYPGVSLPLTISFVHMVYAGVFRGVCRRIVRSERVLDQKKDVYESMVGDANGRLYYKISNWYTVLKFLPMSGRIIPVWQEMLGVKAKTDTSGEVKIPFNVRVMSYFNFIHELIVCPKNMNKLDEIFKDVQNDFTARFPDDLSADEIKLLFDDIRSRLFDVWDVTLINDMYAFIFTGLFKSRMKRSGRSEDEINKRLSDISDIESMKPIKEITRIALEREIYSEVEYLRKKEEYIKKYGDRSLEELKLESRTFRSDPDLFDERIAFYRADMTALRKLCDDIENRDHRETPKGFLCRRAALGIRLREQSRMNRSRAYGMVRTMFLALGRTYYDQNKLSDPRDIFYLTVDEAFSLPENAAVLVEKRKAETELYKQLPAYTRLIFEKEEFNKSHRSVNAYKPPLRSGELRGTPCSSGVVTGEAFVVTDIKKAADVRGKILVTKMTDPGWVFLLAAAKGVVSEKGSLLSHTAIISRELHVPSVVGIEGLMKSIQSGDIIRLDANEGTVEIIDRGELK